MQLCRSSLNLPIFPTILIVSSSRYASNKKDLTDDEIQQVAQRYSEGASIYELADEFGCHRGTISRALKVNGMQVSSRLSDRPGLVEQVVRMYSRGRKTKDIAAETGISVTSVRKILHANGFDLKKSSPQRP